ncbi:hypothetical protein LX24_00784 [Desulfallas thermosapovorans DSM 6562]|uniref:Uncharacterized protein n=1 Tax=Desulfallas thermosapovorans DSM 6562 TaxID=1121431 RepID=A0A5S4ZVE5_9FIRM|nr:hypothetical protein LX24_00784 [Desulfallas thermosapovorans DSM 6562]
MFDYNLLEKFPVLVSTTGNPGWEATPMALAFRPNRLTQASLHV